MEPTLEPLNAFVEPQPCGVVTISCSCRDLDIDVEGATLREAKRNFLSQLPARYANAEIVYHTHYDQEQYRQLLLRAIDLSSTHHLSQRDKGGERYFGHPVRVAERCDTDEQRIVALIHDLLEDTPVTARQLLDDGFPTHIVEALLAVTRRQGETYEQFIDRLATNPIARRVKIADLLDNMDVTRLPILTDDDCRRLQKYHRSWRKLLAISRALGDPENARHDENYE
ncbi:MAG: hypothetical protein IJT30_07435 [Muribaculaceae bacterium]|nr:hypothetical protein [Muribaculaceae bacterium]